MTTAACTEYVRTDDVITFRQHLASGALLVSHSTAPGKIEELNLQLEIISYGFVPLAKAL